MIDCIAEAMSLGLRSYILGKVFQSIPLYFAHWEDARLDKSGLDAAFAALTEEAMACKTRRDFSLLMMAFLATLNNGHTRFRDEVFDRLPSTGMALRPLEDRWTVVRSSLSGLRVGDAVVRIEDKPVELWYEELVPYTVGSSQSRTLQFGDRNAIFPALIGLFLPESYIIEGEDADGAYLTLRVDRTSIQGDVSSDRTWGRWLEGSLAYIKVPSFLDPAFEEQALTLVKEFGRAASLIVDVRGNGGGSTPQRLTRALMNRPYRWWTESSPLNVGLLSYQAQGGHDGQLFGDSQLLRQSPVRDPDPEAYSGRLILLVDCATYSAAEDFVMPFRHNGRATLIGEPTGGSTGQPYYHDFGNGMAFAISTKRAHLPGGGRFEGVGLAPDTLVFPRREDLYAGRDPVLERAIAVAQMEEDEEPERTHRRT